MPVLHPRRAEGYISRIQNLNRFAFNLVVPDSICGDQDLTAFMGVPVVDDARIKYNIMKLRCSGCIVCADQGRYIGRTAEGVCRHGLRRAFKHKFIIRSCGTSGIFFGFQVLVLFLGNRCFFRCICIRGIIGIKNDDLGKPAVRCCSMPVPYTRFNVYHIPFS